MQICKQISMQLEVLIFIISVVSRSFYRFESFYFYFVVLLFIVYLPLTKKNFFFKTYRTNNTMGSNIPRYRRPSATEWSTTSAQIRSRIIVWRWIGTQFIRIWFRSGQWYVEGYATGKCPGLIIFKWLIGLGWGVKMQLKCCEFAVTPFIHYFLISVDMWGRLMVKVHVVVFLSFFCFVLFYTEWFSDIQQI